MPHSLRKLLPLPSRADLVAEVAALGDADLMRLAALARLRARGLPGVEATDLLNEAVLRLLDGSRARPPDVPLIAVLATLMRGVADDHWRQVRRERPVLVRMNDGGEASAADQPDPSPDAERVAAAARALAEIDRLFVHDAVALQIIAGLGGGLTADEIRRTYGLSATAYDSARKRMRRALLRRDGDGGRP